MDADLAHMRSEYSGAPGIVADDPMALFATWFSEAREVVVEPNAMVLSTEGPSSRAVLLKGVDERGFSFFTHHDSRKGAQLAASPRCALHFGWYALHRQVRIEGVAQRLPREEVDAYFAQRPRGAQVGAWASRQSSVVTRTELEAAYAEVEHRFEGQEIPPPPMWGGYVVRPDLIEFWQGRENRMHDRLQFERLDHGWRSQRLAP